MNRRTCLVRPLLGRRLGVEPSHRGRVLGQEHFVVFLAPGARQEKVPPVGALPLRTLKLVSLEIALGAVISSVTTAPARRCLAPKTSLRRSRSLPVPLIDLVLKVQAFLGPVHLTVTVAPTGTD